MGLNIGGMGVYFLVLILLVEIEVKVMEEIVKFIMCVMKECGMFYQGVFYVGLMIKDGEFCLVEYNVCFGDLECQVLMMCLGVQVLDLMQVVVEG